MFLFLFYLAFADLKSGVSNMHLKAEVVEVANFSLKSKGSRKYGNSSIARSSSKLEMQSSVVVVVVVVEDEEDEEDEEE